MLTPSEFFERRVALGEALDKAEPYDDLPYMSDEDARAIVSAINDNTRANLAVAKGLALLCDLLGPEQPRGTFRDLTKDDDDDAGR